MRFLRHLAVVSLVVAVVVVLGLAWNHFAVGTLVGTLPGHAGAVCRIRPGSVPTVNPAAPGACRFRP